MTSNKFIQVHACGATDLRGREGVYILALDAAGTVWEFNFSEDLWEPMTTKRKELRYEDA